MSDVITTLHPENDENTNLYPNVKKANIPFKSIDKNRLDDSIISLLNSINELHPSGTDTSAHILAFTSNKGIYIGTDTGNWYYWNGTQYVSGGTYQASSLDNHSISYDILDNNLEFSISKANFLFSLIKFLNNYDLLIDKTNFVGGLSASGEIVIDGSSNGNVYQYYIPVSPNTTYYVTGNFNWVGSVRCYDVDKQFIQNGTTTGQNIIIPDNSDICYVRFMVGNNTNASFNANNVYVLDSNTTKVNPYLDLSKLNLEDASINGSKIINDSISIDKLGLYKVKFNNQQIYFNGDISVESNNNTLYIHFTSLIMRLFISQSYTRDNVIEILGSSRFGTSPSGVTNCLLINSNETFVYNITSTPRLSVVSRADFNPSTQISLIENVEGLMVGGWLITELLYFYSKNRMDYIIDNIFISPDYVKNEVQNVCNTLDTLQNENTFSFAFITDCHYYNDTNVGIINAFKSMNIINKTNTLKCVIVGGDNTTERATKELKITSMNLFKKVISTNISDLAYFIDKGNHDDGSISSWSLDNNNKYTNKISDGFMYAKYNSTITNPQFKCNTINLGENVSYLDFENEKIRIINLNSNDVLYDAEAQHTFAMTNEQLNWFGNVLLNTPNGYSVIITMHTSPVPSDITTEYVSINGNAMWGLLKAFRNHTSYNSTGTNPDYPYSVDFDYSNKDNDVVGVIVGHIHSDRYDKIDNILIVSTKQAAMQLENQTGGVGTLPGTDGNTYYNTENSADETSYDIFTYNKSTKKLYATRYGAGVDREFDC